jgi:hypothetical protein
MTSRVRQRGRLDALALDTRAGWIEERISAPRRQGQAIFVDGCQIVYEPELVVRQSSRARPKQARPCKTAAAAAAG